MLTILLLVASQTSQPTKADPLMLLGRQRAQWGDYINFERDHYQVSGPYRFRHQPGMIDHPPEMFYPDGEYASRFFLQDLGAETADHVGGVRYWLICETETFTSSSLRRVCRRLPLAEGVPVEMPLELGTLELMLYRRGLRVVGPVPDKAEPGLKSRQGFAAYYIEPLVPTFTYWYVRQDGTETRKAAYHPPWPMYNWKPDEAPNTPFPYPISAEESSTLTEQDWKYRPPISEDIGGGVAS